MCTIIESTPDDVMGITIGFLDVRSLAQLSIASQNTNHTTQTELTHRTMHILLDHVVKGEEKATKIMLDANPALLLVNTANTIDYSGKSIKDLTAFQAAFCAGDADMVTMMQPYFSILDDGDEQMALQIKDIFPEGFDAHLAHQLHARFDFTTAFTAIGTASDDDVKDALILVGAECKQSDTARSKPDSELSLVETMNRFREDFTNTSVHEQIYNSQHLLEALRLYASTLDPANIEIWNWNKRDLFWRQIVGFCQRFVPTCTAQAFAQGLYYIVKTPEYQGHDWTAEPLRRSLKCRYGEWDFYPITGMKSGLGFHYGAAMARPRIKHARRGRGVKLVELTFCDNLFQSKQQEFMELYQQCITQPRSSHP